MLTIDSRVTRPEINDESCPPITWTEVKHAINEIKNNKATGPYLIAAKLTKLCNEIYNTGYWPKDQLSQETKINKIPRIQGNWRNESSHKATSEKYDGPHEREIEAELDNAQSGFRQGKGTREGLLNLRLICERNVYVQKDVNICFLDYEQASHRVRHEPLIQCQSEIGVNGKDIIDHQNLALGTDSLSASHERVVR